MCSLVPFAKTYVINAFIHFRRIEFRLEFLSGAGTHFNSKEARNPIDHVVKIFMD